MVKIKISYEIPQELEKIVTQLKPLGVSIRYPKTEKGTYKRVYIIIK